MNREDLEIGDEVYYLGLGDKYKSKILYIADKKDFDGDDILIDLVENERSHYILARAEKLEMV